MLKGTFDDSSSGRALAKKLAQRIKEANACSDVQSLADILIEYEEDEIGLVVIDVQKVCCDPAMKGGGGNEETDNIAERIQSLASALRKADVPVYAVHLGTPQKNTKTDFYKFSPEPQDTLIEKNKASAFSNGNFKEVLDRDHRKLLLVCGVYLDLCVQATVMDAINKGFDVCLLSDLTTTYTGYPHHKDETLAAMRDKGVAILQSEQVLEALQIANSTARAPKRKATAPSSCR